MRWTDATASRGKTPARVGIRKVRSRALGSAPLLALGGLAAGSTLQQALDPPGTAGSDEDEEYPRQEEQYQCVFYGHCRGEVTHVLCQRRGAYVCEPCGCK